MKKTLAIVSLLLAMVLLLTACGGGGGNIEGTWELVDAKVEGTNSDDVANGLAMIKTMGGSLTLTFKGGKATLEMSAMGQSQSEETTYEIKDGKLVFQGATLDMKFEGNQLTLSEGGNALILKRK